jgi:hypothetical protein
MVIVTSMVAHPSFRLRFPVSVNSAPGATTVAWSRNNLLESFGFSRTVEWICLPGGTWTLTQFGNIN